MAPMISEPPSPRSRRQAFIATCSPDELLGQVIKTLCPRYNIDAPHLLALRQVLSSTIVAPRKPPTLKRTRPDKRIGELGSIHDTSRRSLHGINGPPMSATQTFYFHHKDPDFERLLPQVDRSRYEQLHEMATQSATVTKEVQGSQESAEPFLPDTSATVATQRRRLRQDATPPPAYDDIETEYSSRRAQHLRNTCVAEEPHCDSSIACSVPQKDATANSKKIQPTSIPTITITSPDSQAKSATSTSEDTVVPFPPLRETDTAIELPDIPDIHAVPGLSYARTSHNLQYTDTQDTVNSTQQSDVFSPPVEFVHFTPPTQEEIHDIGLSQIETSVAPGVDALGAIKSKVTSPHMNFPMSLLGKHPRTEAESADNEQGAKRSKAAA
ncbi:hypothetical protein OPT61_g2556 [Boeremia exigua]|uniref:Uncharacterized protein n=1 Tax=Boeremia exigua TaxID=749465 RepID=A0ACC2IL35_9PLEO|nr:hypothetical protein OPT61_g2556 [Boeremia exigua]